MQVQTYDASDCEPTTTTATPGCFRGGSYKAQANNKDRAVTTATPEPRCCADDSAAANDKCNLASHAQYVCRVEDGDVEVNCTYTATTTALGCCRDSSYKVQFKCLGLDDQMACERKACDWLLTDDSSSYIKKSMWCILWIFVNHRKFMDYGFP